jgi:glycosyltransferase involved in cell wall biosynthesis
MPRPRVLFVLANDWYFYWHRLAIAQRLAAAGYDVHAATPPGRFCAAIAAAGIAHHPIAIDRQGLNPLRDVATVKRLAGLYRELRPQLVHHVAFKPVIYGTIAAKIAGVPAIVNALPGTGYLFVSKQLLARAIRPAVSGAFRLLLNGRNSRVIVENGDDRNKWIAGRVLRPDRVVVMPGCGVDTEAFKPAPVPSPVPPPVPPADPPLVVLAARLLFYKGVTEFVDAARMLKGRGIRARFALLGDGDPGNPASIPPERLRQWQEEGIVELLGWQDDVAKVFAKTNVVCLPSHGGEGVPRSLLEAAACGVAIVTTDVPGCRDIVHDDDNGLLVPPRQVIPLADALERLIGDAPLRERMGARGRERALAEFSVDIVAAQTLELYEKLLGSSVTKKSRPLGSIENDAPVGENKS